jgi:hypothetical protein
MKLRLSEKHLCFRLTRDEAKALLSSHNAQAVLYFPDGATLSYAIACTDVIADFSLAYQPGNIQLFVPAPSLNALIACPTKDGLVGRYEVGDKTVVFSLEINLRSL